MRTWTAAGIPFDLEASKSHQSAELQLILIMVITLKA